MVYGQYYDLEWYRAIVIATKTDPDPDSTYCNQTTTDFDETTDTIFQFGLLYDLFFVDFGNKQSDVRNSQICSVEQLNELNNKLHILDNIPAVFSMPFQAHRCQIPTRNAEDAQKTMAAFQTFAEENSGIFEARLLVDAEHYEVLTSRDGARIDAFKYTVSVGKDGVEVIGKLEEEKKKVAVTEVKVETKKEEKVVVAMDNSQRGGVVNLNCDKELKIGEIYGCQYLFCSEENEEIFVNLEENIEKMVRTKMRIIYLTYRRIFFFEKIMSYKLK
jgi:YHS domain-containing protein